MPSVRPVVLPFQESYPARKVVYVVLKQARCLQVAQRFSGTLQIYREPGCSLGYNEVSRAVNVHTSLTAARGWRMTAGSDLIYVKRHIPSGTS